jgi:hypothetical protein
MPLATPHTRETDVLTYLQKDLRENLLPKLKVNLDKARAIFEPNRTDRGLLLEAVGKQLDLIMSKTNEECHKLKAYKVSVHPCAFVLHLYRRPVGRARC